MPQNLYEFWALATRPVGPRPVGENGLGMSIEQARAWIQFFCRKFVLLPDRDSLQIIWLDLVVQNRVRGFRCHDVRLVAAMKSYGIQRILTLNVKDFAGLDISLLDPQMV